MRRATASAWCKMYPVEVATHRGEAATGTQTVARRVAVDNLRCLGANINDLATCRRGRAHRSLPKTRDSKPMCPPWSRAAQSTAHSGKKLESPGAIGSGERKEIGDTNHEIAESEARTHAMKEQREP